VFVRRSPPPHSGSNSRKEVRRTNRRGAPHQKQHPFGGISANSRGPCGSKTGPTTSSRTTPEPWTPRVRTVRETSNQRLSASGCGEAVVRPVESRMCPHWRNKRRVRLDRCTEQWLLHSSSCPFSCRVLVGLPLRSLPRPVPFDPVSCMFFMALYTSALDRLRLSCGLYLSFSKVSLIATNDFCRLEADLPTAALRTIEPLKPVRPACSDPITMMR